MKVHHVSIGLGHIVGQGDKRTITVNAGGRHQLAFEPTIGSGSAPEEVA